MKTSLFTCLLASLALGATAQKIAIKRDLITVDGQPYARIEQGQTREYYISSPQHERLFVVKPMSLPELSGSVDYLQFVFTGSHTLVETPRPLSSFSLLPPIKVARMIYDARLLKNGTLDPQAVADFEVNYGAPYSARRQALNQFPAVLVPSGH